MSYDKAADLIKKHEGFRDHVYLDSEGIPTCGYGHALLVNSKVPHYIADRFFHNDFRATIDDYELLGLELDEVRRAVVLNMLFNLGFFRFSKFKNFIAALKSEDWSSAKEEMLDSKWAKQVGNRATELAEMMLAGEWPE